MPTESLRFVKAEANGNDFLIIDAEAVPAAQRPEFVRRICDRHRGLGADGVEFVRSHDHWLELDLWNADGGRAEISGNGTRCVAAFYARHGFREGRLATGAGDVHARIDQHQDAISTVTLDLPAPALEGARTLEIAGRRCPVYVLSMGNPQCIVKVESFPADWQAQGAALAAHAQFPYGTNVEFVRVLRSDAIEIRIFERGVGPTASSGTGSAAAAVAAVVNGWARSPIRVTTPGGVQEVAWEGAQAAVQLTGPARIIGEGIYLWLNI